MLDTIVKPIVVLPLWLALNLGVLALPCNAADLGKAARLAAGCTACHGPAGAAVGGGLPALSGQDKKALLSSLQAYKSGSRPSTVMQQLAKGYSDEQLELMADHFSTQKAKQE
jgi:cytochrome c553